MSIISLKFLLFLIVTTFIYYVIPKKFQWISLLLFSIIFFILSGKWLIFYLVICVLVAFVGTNLMAGKFNKEKGKKYILFLTLLIIIGMLFMLKYFNIIPMTINSFAKLFSINLNFSMLYLIAPLGISYYTLSTIGYVIDVYRGAYKPLKNPFKLLLFSSYYPMMISGPILRYKEMKNELFESKNLDYTNVFMGFERVIFGIMKKMVIADQLAILVSEIFAAYHIFSGFYIIYGVILYAIQIYCDFSGCMDIVIGASGMYGVKLPENFDSPFFSRSLSEFWRRWHISLGTWAKDYIMYPLLKSDVFQKLGARCRKKFGKKIGKKIPTIIAIFILWILIGLWHGASYKYIFAAGILPWLYLTLSQMFENFNNNLTTKLHINTECFSFHLFQSIRTFLLMCFIWLVVCSPNLSSFLDVIKSVFVYNSGVFGYLSKIPVNAIFLMLLLVLLVDYLNYKGKNAFVLLQKQNIIFRYFILLFVIAIILIFGAYGPGYNAVDFIYGGF